MTKPNECLSSLVYVYPLMALITLLVHVLQYPERQTVASDIQFMDMISGHLSYVDFTSADLEFPFAKDVTNLARLAVSRGRAQAAGLKESKIDKDTEARVDASDTGLGALPELDLLPLEDVRHQVCLPEYF